MLFSIVVRLHYGVMVYAQEVTVFRSDCGRSNVSADQQEAEEEGQSSFGRVRNNWAKCGCALRMPVVTITEIARLLTDGLLCLLNYIQ